MRRVTAAVLAARKRAQREVAFRAAAILRGALFALLLAYAGLASAQFRSIAEHGMVMYDGPSTRAVKLFVASRGYPVEVISSDGAWFKVRDVAGDLAWVEKKALSDHRTVLVNTQVAEIRQKPETGSPVTLQVAQGVVLDLLEQNPPGWVRVRHRDGVVGFVRLRDVWGV